MLTLDRPAREQVGGDLLLSDAPVVLDARVVTGCGGGPDKTILNSPRFLAESGYRMLCAYMHPPEDPGFEQLRRKAERSQAPLLSIPDRGPWDWRVIGELYRICRRERVRIWHGHDYKSNLLGLLLRPFWPMRLVTTVHGWVRHTRRTPLYYGLDRFSLRGYEKVLCVSDDLFAESRACGVREDRCLLLENGIDTTEYTRRQTPTEARRKVGIAPQRYVIGAAGRLSPEKGFDFLIRAADQLLRQQLDLELIILGEGDEASNLQALIDQLGRRDRIRLLGYQSDPRIHYEAMDVFALSSLREGLPNVLLEALALEVPAVCTAVAGVPRLIRDGHNGLLVQPGEPGALADAIGRLIRNPELRARISGAGRETVEKQYSFARRMQRLTDIYDDLLQRVR